MAINAYRNYGNNTSALSKNLEKLSSGYRVNRAGDDAAGLAISEKMRAQIQGLNAAQKNVKDAISFVKTDEGAMQEIQDMLSRMKYLATQSANGTYENTVDRAALQDEVNSLLKEIDRIADSANFNDIHMLNGTEDKEDDGSSSSSGGGVIGEEQKKVIDALVADIKAGTSTNGATAWTDGANTGSGDPAKMILDFDGLTFDADGKVTVTMGGKSFDVAVTKGMDAKGFAAALAKAYNDAGSTGQIADADSSVFGVTDNGDGTLTFEASDDSTMTNPFTDFAIAAAKSDDSDDEVASSYTVEIKAADNKDLDTDKLSIGDKITINGKEYEVAADGTDDSKIDGSTATTLNKQIAAAVDLYNKESGEDWTAEYDAATGKLTFTAKDGAEPTAAPTFALPDGTIGVAGEVTPVKTGGGNSDWESQGTPTYYNITMQIGDTSKDYNRMTMSIRSMKKESLGIEGVNIGK